MKFKRTIYWGKEQKAWHSRFIYQNMPSITLENPRKILTTNLIIMLKHYKCYREYRKFKT